MRKRWDETADFDADLQVSASVRCKGYSDPGVCSGPPENCYPPEGENEGTIVYVEIGKTRFSAKMTAEEAKAAVDAMLAEVERDIEVVVQEWEPSE